MFISFGWTENYVISKQKASQCADELAIRIEIRDEFC